MADKWKQTASARARNVMLASLSFRSFLIRRIIPSLFTFHLIIYLVGPGSGRRETGRACATAITITLRVTAKMQHELRMKNSLLFISAELNRRTLYFLVSALSFRMALLLRHLSSDIIVFERKLRTNGKSAASYSSSSPLFCARFHPFYFILFCSHFCCFSSFVSIPASLFAFCALRSAFFFRSVPAPQTPTETATRSR